MKSKTTGIRLLALMVVLLAACSDDANDVTLIGGADDGTSTSSGANSGMGSGSSSNVGNAGNAGNGATNAGNSANSGTPTNAGNSGNGATNNGTTNPPDCSAVRRRADTSNPARSASWRYGGGHGYPDAVRRVDACMTVVSTYDELVAALNAATAGDIVYVSDDARIDITGPTLEIPGGVWLASGRGVDGSAGALLYGTEIVNRALLQAGGPDVRLTGIRLYGPDPGQCPPQYPNACTGTDRTGGRNCRDCMPRTSGIRTVHDRLEVDNSEIAGFGLAGVSATDSVGHRVHHSHLHHNQRQGLGYGVLLGRGRTGTVQFLVDHNRMDYMRHAIAGSGEPGQDYEARDNLVLEHANGHVFDMHGEDENTDNGSELAGGEMLIHGNTVLVNTHYTLVVRGRPQQGAWLYDNCVARSSSDAVLQRFHTGNLYVDESPNGAAANQYGRSGPDCEPVRWCVAGSGAGPWRYLTASSFGIGTLGFADFDGNGRTDVFNATGSKWQVVYDGTGPWTDLNTSTAPLDRLRFGDFDGDGKADVFSANGRSWRMSSGGNTPWQELRADSSTLSELGFGDFDGDGMTDVFRATGSEWQVSYGGTAAWDTLNVSGSTLPNLRFGDFDGDGTTDVFSTSGGRWRWSRGGSRPWADLNTSGVGVGELEFADVDGDGKTDALRNDGERWVYSPGAASGWRVLRIDTHDRSEVVFSDFDGDGSADLFRTRCH